MLSKTQFPDIVILKFAFFGPLLGALARPLGGFLSDKFGGIRVTFINFVVMAVFAFLLFFTLPGKNDAGSFAAFFGVFMVLFFTAGLGSGSTFQMIAVVFRKITTERVLAQGGTEKLSMKLSPKVLPHSVLSLPSALSAGFYPECLWYFTDTDRLACRCNESVRCLYVVCILTTWLVYGRKIINSILIIRAM